MQSRLGPKVRGMAAVAMLIPGLLSTAAAADPAQVEFLGNGRVGVYADMGATERCAAVAPGGFTTLYVVGTLGGDTTTGMTGAEFRVEVSNPSGWSFFYSAPADAAITLGSPMDLTPNDPTDLVGLNIAFSTCRLGPRVLLGTILAFNQGGGPTDLVVKRRNPSSNPHSTCPLFTRCDVDNWEIVCLGTCSSDPLGEDIASTMSLNSPKCTSAPACAADCPGAPCVSIALLGSATDTVDRFVCQGEPVELAAHVTNCGSTPEDIDVFIDYQPAGSFAAVAPGQTITASRMVVQSICDNAPDRRHPIGAVARNATCPDPVGDEIQANFACDPRACGGNLPPDCSNAHATVTELLPVNGELVPVQVTNVVDPNGDPVSIQIIDVSSDEVPGDHFRPGCPDAFIDGPNLVRLRAERDLQGNGRVYVIRYEARDPSTFRCFGRVRVCVPRKPGVACIEDAPLHSAVYCDYRGGVGDRRFGGGLDASPENGGISVTFENQDQGPVAIQIYDIRGRRVAVMANGSFAPGLHTVHWNGLDMNGHAAASGVYLIRAEFNHATFMRKTVLIR